LEIQTVLRGCPFKAKFIEEASGKKENELNGPGMINYIKNKNVELETFITNKALGIKLDDKDYVNDVNTLLDIKKDLEDIDKNLEENNLLLDTMMESIKALEEEKGMKKEGQKRDQNNENYVKLLKSAKDTKKEINSVIGVEQDKCRVQIKKFEEKLNEERKNLKNKPFYK
jgi:hypothetical protein